MEINGKIKADFAGLSIKHYASTGVRMAEVMLHWRVPYKDAEKVLGENLAILAFGSMQGENEGAGFDYLEIKPSVKCAKHTVRLKLGDDYTSEPLGVIPEIRKIKPVEDVTAVVVHLALPFEATSKTFLGELACTIGDVIEAKLAPQQMELPGIAVNPPAVTKKAGPHGNVVPMAAR